MPLIENTAALRALLAQAESLPDRSDGGGSSPALQEKSVTPSTQAQTVTPDSGFDGLSKVSVSAMPEATQATPSITVSSGGLITASATQTAGYVVAGTKSATKQLTTKGAATITPTKAAQTIPGGTYLTGDQTVAAIPAHYVDTTSGTATAEDIAKGKISFVQGQMIEGTHECSSGKNVQIYHGMKSVSTTSYSATGVKLTVAKTGTYKVSWMGARNRNSGTSGSQLFINGTAYGSANTSFTSTYAQSVVLSGVALTAGQEIEIRARASTTSYVMMVGNLAIEEV